jgi:hypothetical protein
LCLYFSLFYLTCEEMMLLAWNIKQPFSNFRFDLPSLSRINIWRTLQNILRTLQSILYPTLQLQQIQTLGWTLCIYILRRVTILKLHSAWIHLHIWQEFSLSRVNKHGVKILATIIYCKEFCSCQTFNFKIKTLIIIIIVVVVVVVVIIIIITVNLGTPQVSNGGWNI